MCTKCLTLRRETKDPGGAVVLNKLVVKKDTKKKKKKYNTESTIKAKPRSSDDRCNQSL